jgi:signal transduction histidine kinase
VKVDRDGVRILARRDGKNVTLKIDSQGVRVEDLPEESTTRAGSGVLVAPSGVLVDPDKMTEAIESARDRIEAIVQEQVDRQVARTTRVYRERSSDWFMSFLMLLIVTSVIAKVLLGSKRKAETRARAASATAAEEGLKRQLVEAQLKMMQAQVEPHFLFNTLASVDYLIETDPARASKMQKNLIQYLRAALPQMREGSTTLGKELSLVRSYLEILKVRMEDRLQFAITVPQGLMSAQFPPMVLQSLVENAIKHALEPKPEGGSITVTADIANGNLRVTVADTGLGFGVGGKAGTGVGLANVRERLAALYGGRARFTIEANAPAGTIATVEVPYEPDLDRDAVPHTSAGVAA